MLNFIYYFRNIKPSKYTIQYFQCDHVIYYLLVVKVISYFTNTTTLLSVFVRIILHRDLYQLHTIPQIASKVNNKEPNSDHERKNRTRLQCMV